MDSFSTDNLYKQSCLDSFKYFPLHSSGDGDAKARSDRSTDLATGSQYRRIGFSRHRRSAAGSQAATHIHADVRKETEPGEDNKELEKRLRNNT